MGLKADIEKLKKLVRPKKTIKFVLYEKLIDETQEGVIWVLLDI